MLGVDVPPYGELPETPKPNNPQISVCLTTYNRPEWVILKCVKSILNQKFPPKAYEVILVDDASEERLEDYCSAVDEILREYPKHNFRSYHTTYTRCGNDPHTFNVAFKRALGWIIMMDQTDDYHVGETLECAWRHHNMGMPKLGLCPAHYTEEVDGSLREWPRAYYPGEFGTSIRTKRIIEVKGRNEDIQGRKNTAIIDFFGALRLLFAEDRSVRTIHMDGSRFGIDLDQIIRVGYPDQGYKQAKYRLDLARPWTDGDWGTLSPQEEEAVRMTERMKLTLGG